MVTGKYEVGSMLICKYSGQPYWITKIDKCKRGYKKYWVKGRGKYSANAMASKKTLKSLYVPAKPAAQVLYGQKEN